MALLEDGAGAMDEALGSGLDPAEHSSHHGEVAELYERHAQNRRQRVAPVNYGDRRAQESPAQPPDHGQPNAKLVICSPRGPARDVLRAG